MQSAGEGEDRDVVVVPRAPGPLVALSSDEGGGRERDDLDDLIDELLPDIDDRPGWFDAGLVVGGGALAVAAVVASLPTIALVAGCVAAGIGCILPIRTAWRSGQRRLADRRRATVLAAGHPLHVAAPETARLVAAYHDLLVQADETDLAVPAVAAAHGALLDAATLLDGRPPVSQAERAYVTERSAAIEELAVALRQLRTTPGLLPNAVVEARVELDELTRSSSIQRLAALTEEARRDLA